MGLKEKILKTLKESKLVSEEEINKALELQKETGGSLSEVLLKLGLIDEKSLLLIFSKDLGIPPIELSRFKVSEELTKIIPFHYARKHKVIPVGKISNTLTVAMSDPLNIFALDDLKKLTGLEINPVLASSADIEAALERFYQESAKEEIENILEKSSSSKLELVQEEKRPSEDETVVLKEVKEGPVVKITNLILTKAVEEKASDVLIEPMEKSMRVRFRIDGVLCEREAPPLNMQPLITSRIKVMANLDIAEHRLPQDGRFRMRIGSKDVDFRVSIVPSVLGEKVALRILDKSQALLNLDALGFEEGVVEKIKQVSLRPHGMIISCGPTGCGKTTTLYSILKYIDSPEKNIITVEDPIEYELKGINQVQVRPEVGLTFASSLRSILRQDPDIIMVGEIRDFDTVDIAIKAALTGHLVLSTLHTTTACGSVTRLVNMGVEPFLVTSSLLGVLAQRLLRKLCLECREEGEVPEYVRKVLNLEKEVKVYKPKGCKKCGNTGYRGRIGICEFLEITETIKELILKSSPEGSLKERARQEGMQTLREDAVLKLKKGLTSLEEVLRVTAQD
ncbi:MAG: type II secretion system protein GspE [Candidatus Omnitrophota bacterium]|nr:MAG: type II secretion system protein GspE [Candidatus Omnitrophota bacterium]RKY34765.1 MAG: type II secretion system protein GspE [Candidatus Omnitrophota bacterium]RKY44561.1 MAG: type II secretion system protein GspE [Candidatus Omnitrophota bacterium]